MNEYRQALVILLICIRSLFSLVVCNSYMSLKMIDRKFPEAYLDRIFSTVKVGLLNVKILISGFICVNSILMLGIYCTSEKKENIRENVYLRFWRLFFPCNQK